VKFLLKTCYCGMCGSKLVVNYN